MIINTEIEAIMALSILESLRGEILPRHYRQNLQHKVDNDCLLFKKGSYVALAMPFSRVPKGDYGNVYAKGIVRSALTCIPFFFEKGLFLIYYGDKQEWRDCWMRFEVDMTALRPVILQSIHFIDPQTGENENTRTQWGPIKFGFCGKLIDDLEKLGKSLAWNNAFSPSP